MQERKRLEDIIKELPEDLRKELEDFADKFNNYLKKEEDNVNINY
jgi:hypothetical protein